MPARRGRRAPPAEHDDVVRHNFPFRLLLPAAAADLPGALPPLKLELVAVLAVDEDNRAGFAPGDAVVEVHGLPFHLRLRLLARVVRGGGEAHEALSSLELRRLRSAD